MFTEKIQNVEIATELKEEIPFDEMYTEKLNDTPRSLGTSRARLISVIETEAKKGFGTKDDPVRYVKQYWDTDGNFLAERDSRYDLKDAADDLNATTNSLKYLKAHQLLDK